MDNNTEDSDYALLVQLQDDLDWARIMLNIGSCAGEKDGDLLLESLNKLRVRLGYGIVEPLP